MIIERIDVYWVRVPLAFVWRTSYADQHDTDTIVVRMESEGHNAWGESCPPFIPAYSADHTLATYHTVCEHLAPRLIGQDLLSVQDLLDRIDFVKGNQPGRERDQSAARRGRDPAGRLPRGERQDGSRRRPGGVAPGPGAVRGARDSLLDRRHARDGHRRRDLR
jgi:hypothetical protein